MVREDVHGGLTSVALRGKVRTLYTNGKFQGDDGHELVAQRSFAACDDCHGTEEIARDLFVGLNDRVAMEVAVLDSLIALSGDHDPQDGIFTVADGVWFNARLAEKKGSTVHNPVLVKELLRASRQAMMDEYGI